MSQLSLRIKHAANINEIFGTKFEAVWLCRALTQIERRVHKAAEQWCNGDINEDRYDQIKEDALYNLTQLLGDKIPIKINSDPRGYALKIPDEYVREHDLKIYRDWGGYGIICPEEVQ